MKILFIIALCIFVALSFYRYRFVSANKYIEYVEKRIIRMRTTQRDLEELSPLASKVSFWSAYVLSLIIKISVVYLSCLGISML